DVVLARRRILVQQLARHQNEAGRAEAALERARLDEGLLDRIELLAIREAFDRLEARAVGEHGKKQTTGDGAAVEDDGAAAPQPLGAALARAAEPELLQQLDQILMRRHGRRHRLAVERKADGTRRRHGLAPPEPLAPSLPQKAASGRRLD